MQKVRSNQLEREFQRIDSLLHLPNPPRNIAAQQQENYRITPQAFSLITSTQFMACFMTYISDIFGLGNSFRRMFHTMYVIVLLLKNVPYYESNRKLRNKGNSLGEMTFGENIFGGFVAAMWS